MLKRPRRPTMPIIRAGCGCAADHPMESFLWKPSRLALIGVPGDNLTLPRQRSTRTTGACSGGIIRRSTVRRLRRQHTCRCRDRPGRAPTASRLQLCHIGIHSICWRSTTMTCLARRLLDARGLALPGMRGRRWSDWRRGSLVPLIQ